MKSQLILIVFLFASFLSRAQVIDIYVTNQLKESDKGSLNAYIDGLNKTLHRKYNGMSIMLHDYYSDYQSLIKDEKDLLNFFVEENKLFTSENLFLEELESNLKSENSALIPVASGKLPSCKNLFKDMNSLNDFVKGEFRKSRKNKEEVRVRVFFYNGYLLGKQDPKRLQSNLTNAQRLNDFSKLKPRFSWNGDKSFLPSGEMGNYIIQFDSVGFYDSYEFRITSLSKSAPGDLVNLVLKFDDVNSSDYKLTYSGYNRTCKIEFSSEYLGTKCFGLSAGQYDVGDEDCSVCKEACLYGKAFQMSVLGICGDLKIENLRAKTSSEYNITFQCKNLVK
jgi:hypothetical protein